MKSTFVFAALIGFALINSAFLGAHLLFPSSGAATFGPATTVVATTTETSTATATSTVTSAATSTAATVMAIANSSAPSNYTLTTSTIASSPTFSYGATVGSTSSAPAARSSFALVTVAEFFEVHSLTLAPTSWFLVGGMWIWRGRMKSRWMNLGFDSDVFGLFVRMKGAKTRIRLLDALSRPKDRLQLAQELGLDWKAVDRHIAVLDKYGFVHETVAYGKVRMYELTSTGKLLLQLLDELNRQDEILPRQGVAPAISSDESLVA